MIGDTNSPYIQNISPVTVPLAPQPVTPSVQIPVYPVIPEVIQAQDSSLAQKPRYGSYDIVKVVLRNKPVTVFCPNCKQNIMTDLKGRRITLYIHFSTLMVDYTTPCCSSFLSSP